jgi:hypothetical protein
VQVLVGGLGVGVHNVNDDNIWHQVLTGHSAGRGWAEHTGYTIWHQAVPPGWTLL